MSIRNYGECPAPEIVWFTTSIISTSFSHKLKIPSPWRKHVTRGARVILSLFYGFPGGEGHSPRSVVSGRAPKMEISMPTGRRVVVWISPSERCLWSDVVHRCYELN